jgi:putative addiction module component (TIGR02574 family)
MSLAEIQKSVSALPEKERAKLAGWLLDSLPPSSSDDVGNESLEEADRRRQELDSGHISPLSEAEFREDIARARKLWK